VGSLSLFLRGSFIVPFPKTQRLDLEWRPF
jgi:hypothetical protein